MRVGRPGPYYIRGSGLHSPKFHRFSGQHVLHTSGPSDELDVRILIDGKVVSATTIGVADMSYFESGGVALLLDMPFVEKV